MTVRKSYRLKHDAAVGCWEAEFAGNRMVFAKYGSVQIWLSEDQFAALFEEREMLIVLSPGEVLPE